MSQIDLLFDVEQGLLLHLPTEFSATRQPIAIRVKLDGSKLFSVWSIVDSGEDLPAWSEKDYSELFFGNKHESPEITCSIEKVGNSGFRVGGASARATVKLEICLRNNELSTTLLISNPYIPGSRPLPLATAELILDDISVSPQATYLSAHPYGGQSYGYGNIAEISAPGVEFSYGCIGLALPLLYLHNPNKDGGMQFEIMLDGRPQAWLRPTENNDSVAFTLSWNPNRLLEIGQSHTFGGALQISPYKGQSITQLRNWRDKAASRYGLTSVQAPKWLRESNMVEFNMNPESNGHPFTRLDDERCYQLLQGWKDLGYNSIFAVSCNNVGINWLSPYDYRPSDKVGGAPAEAKFLQWAKELGFHVLLWVTTVGIDRNAPEVRDHPEWFTLRANGEYFYAWDSNPQNNYLGYAPDADPLSSGWRQWLREQVRDVIERGYDGIFIDGCIPRADNHARWNWPGESRNSVEDQVVELADFLRTLGDGLVTFVEDESTRTQASCEVTAGRYHPAPPFRKKAFWDQGMGGGPQQATSAPERIPPEWVRDYLLLRYASLLPGALSSDIVEGYLSEAARPWTVQALMANLFTKTHSQYIDNPEKYLTCAGIEPPPLADQEADHRLKGHTEFIELLRFRRDKKLLHSAPLSIEAIQISGDAAVVGLLRPSKERCIMTIIQFADRPAQVEINLTAAIDLTTAETVEAGNPAAYCWHVHELMHSMCENSITPDGTISAEKAITVKLANYSFRIFELIRAD